MVDVASQTFHMVSKELANTIQEARAGLEEFVENQSRLQSLGQTADCLHTAQGVLRMVEIYGAALLAEEMEGVSRYLLKNAGRGKNQADALDSLTRAMVQLPTYLDRVQSGGRDIALVLLPLLNDLRAVRGHHLLSEGTLLMLNLHSDHMGPSGERRQGNVPELARRLRPKFQASLLGWIKGEQSDANLKHLAAVAEALEMTATNPNVFQLWWVVGGVIESLREGGLETSVSVKRLLAQADRQIKQLIDRGEKVFTQDTALELLNNLLYYVARSTSRGKKVSSIRNSFHLGEVLPADEQIEIARESLSAPSVKLMKTVAAAIKEDLTQVKDVLDIYVRTGKQNVEELTPQLDMLKKISDTLGVLGLGGLRADIQSEISQLQEIIKQGTAADDMLIQMAATLLGVEDSLDEQLVRLILPLKDLDDEAARIEEDVEFRQVTKAVVRECIINLARVKEAVTQTLADPQDAHVMDKVPHLLRGITAGLLMLGKTRAVGLVERIGAIIRSSLQPGMQRLTDTKLDRLADAIVSVEYYMETVQSGRSDPWYMLDNAQACLEALERTQAAQEMPLAMGDEVKSYARAVGRPTAKAPAGKPPTARPATPPEAPPKRAVKAEAEFVELFIEEAKEEIASIQKEFPKWADDPNKAEALAVVRRSFHTLKGSGRMVGADLIGEFAWSIEDLLNRVINGTLSRTGDMVQFLTRAVRALPELVTQLESGSEPSVDVHALMTEARNFTEPEISSETTSVPVIQPEPERPTLREPQIEEDSQIQPLDPVLQEIFTKESAEHLQVIKHYLEQCRLESAPYVVSEPFYRSCHTLNGSANMAGVAPAVKIAGPLNQYVRKLYDHGLPLSEGARAACAEVVTAFEEILRHINESTGYFRDHNNLVHAFQHLEAEADQAIAAQQHESGDTSEVQVLRIETPAEQPEEDPASASGVAPAQFDAEIAAIFSEEASELLDATDEAVRAWMSNQQDIERLAELKRHLHTIKGGARMAGVATMGDLSHELESLFVGIQAGDVTVDEQLKELLQQSIDELHRMRDLVAAGKSVPPAGALAARIRQYSEPEPLTPREGLPAAPQPDAAVADELSTDLAAPAEAAVHPHDASEVVEPEEQVMEPSLEQPPEAPAPAELLEDEEQKVIDIFAEPEAQTAPPAESVELEVEREREILEQIIEESLTEPERVQMPVPEPAQTPSAWGAQPAAQAPREVVRVNAELLETLLNNAGEIMIFRSRLEQQIKSIEFNLNELSQTVLRLKDQLRTMEMETEAQILNRHQEEVAHVSDFDPLEMDRYSTLQQMSRALAESVSDVASIKDLVDNNIQESTTLLTQQARVTTELQDGLMRTRMVPFQRYVPRLSRIVRQAASETGKRAELIVEGSSGELDRQVLENMLPPFEHLIRNAVIHGIESPVRRRESGKPETGRITLRMHREGSEVVIQINDDGAGLDIEAIKRRAESENLILPGQAISDEDAMQLVLEPGFSTASEVTQAAGRGVGMDVVATEITKLGGSLKIGSQAGKGATFTVRLPFTLAITQALIVRVGEEFFALPLPTVEAVVRIPKSELEKYLAEDSPVYAYAGEQYHFRHLGLLVGSRASPLPEDDSAAVPLILVRAGEHSSALVTDELVGSREIVVKSVGPQISAIRGISGATILGDGSVVMILDVGTIVRSQLFGRGMSAAAVRGETDRRIFVLVVDDSITVRRVTQRLLERNGMRVMTAKDGVDAVSVLQEHRPDVMLLDIEMPRMDGYEVAAHVRKDENLKEIPIIMVTSRVGKKHRARAMELGVNDYLGKPYQENQLLEAIEPLVRSE